VDTPTQSHRDWLRVSIIMLALSYALLAGLRTVSDFDLGWQLATGRTLVEHHQIPRVELFSYTAHGNEWIYPPFSGAIFYLLYLVGGYSALSWLGALACAATVAFLCGAGGRLTAILAIVAVPAIAFRTIPRAELFTTVLFAAVLAIVWNHHAGRRVRVWILPVIFLCWVNLHLGFISGLGILGAGILFELCDLPFAERRGAAFERLKRVVPWFAASFVATMVNPWGWRIYEALYRQNKVMQVHSAFISEWSSVQLNSLAWRQALNARDPASADWWLIGAAVAAILVALWKKRFGPAMVLTAGIYLSLQHIRLQGLFAILAVVIGGALLGEIAKTVAASGAARSNEGEREAETAAGSRVSPRIAFLGVAVLALLAGIRVADLVSDRYYLDAGQLSLFGTGPSWWYPERAMAFLEREHLPRNIFHDYALGGYLTWRIGEEYPDFVDGRYIPFGKELFAEQKQLMSAGPDSAEWQKAAEHWRINTLIFSVARYAGLGTFPLQEYCASKAWRLVYLDDVSAIFLRDAAENAGAIGKLGIHCENAAIAPPAMASGNSYRARAERFNALMNAASIFYALARDTEAATALEQAEQLFPNNPNLHLVKAQFYSATNRFDEAEREYLRVVRTSPSDVAWYALARLYAGEHRYAEALHCMQEAVPLSLVPYERLRGMGVLHVYLNQPQEALTAFERAEEKSPYRGDSSNLGGQFNAQVAEGRARAYRQLADVDRAVIEQESAVRLSPENAAWWTELAELYQVQGQAEKAAQAREKAQAMQRKIASISKAPQPAEKK
jgi:tetratricopeptide (TPR) repeat protein